MEKKKYTCYSPSVNEFLNEHGDDLHHCYEKNGGGFSGEFECYEWVGFTLNVSANNEFEVEVNYCPFCGFKSRVTDK